MKFEYLILIVIAIIVIILSCTECIENITESFATTIADADISAIRNLNGMANTLMQPNGTLTNPGNLNINGNMGISGTLSIPSFSNVASSLTGINSSISSNTTSINTINTTLSGLTSVINDSAKRGYIKIPGGAIIEYGYSAPGQNVDGGGYVTITFTSGLFKNVYGINLTTNGNQPGGNYPGIMSINKDSVKINPNPGAYNNLGIFWVAYGS